MGAARFSSGAAVAVVFMESSAAVRSARSFWSGSESDLAMSSLVLPSSSARASRGVERRMPADVLAEDGHASSTVGSAAAAWAAAAGVFALFIASMADIADAGVAVGVMVRAVSTADAESMGAVTAWRGGSTLAGEASSTLVSGIASSMPCGGVSIG